MDTPRFFIHPSGAQWRLDRAITRDNWLTWRHVLPAVETDCLTVRYKRLDPAICRQATRLAKGLHAALMQQRPRGVEDCPWTVYRWWRPRDGEPFASGSACEFKVDGINNDELFQSAAQHGLVIDRLFGPMLIARLKN